LPKEKSCGCRTEKLAAAGAPVQRSTAMVAVKYIKYNPVLRREIKT